jgi:radical SAM superfamily enzyme YgiQ (UPF0313 family)
MKILPKSPDKKYLLFLINPRQKYVNYYAQTELSRIMGVKKFMIPLAIPMVAALVPPDFDIRIIDEDSDPLPEELLPDIVGISTLASTAGRSYEIADWYTARAVPVVIGGPYVSFMQQEALKHCDSVVVGEAEGLWETCLADFSSGQMKKVYERIGYCEFKQSPPPRWDLIPKDYFFQVGVQVSRGCPYQCEFCLVTELFGHKMRYRDIDNVVEELKSLPVKKILFVDDNLTVKKKYTRELMQRIKPLNLSWGCMASIEIAEDEELLREMKEAGCFNILIGFESLNADSLDETHKKHNRAATIFEDAIEKIHNSGIHITASFMIGFDSDTPAEFEKIYQFTQKTGLSYLNFNILGAIPGSALYKRLNAEGRLYDIEPELISGLFPTMHYYQMGQLELFDHYFNTVERMYAWDSLLEKARILFGKGYFIEMFHDGPPTATFRAKIVFYMLRQWWFSGDRNKRKLFSYLFKLVISKKAAIDNASAYMLAMIGYHDYIAGMRKNIEEYRDIIREHDKGPWIKMSQKQTTDNEKQIVSEYGSNGVKTETYEN